MIVIDASVALDLVLATAEGREISSRLHESREDLAAPELIDLEVLQAVRRQVLLKQIEKRRAEDALELYAALPLERFGHRPLAARIWALRDNLTAYDAAYVALAELLDAPIWTRDQKIANAAGVKARVEIL